MYYKQKTDNELCKLVNESNEQAFCELYVRYAGRLTFFCLKFIKQKNLAEDIVQGIFTTLWEKKELNSDLNFSSYLFTIARNRTLNCLRQKANEAKGYESFQSTIVQTCENTENTIHENEYDELLNNAVLQLSPQKQKAFILSRYEGLSHIEIASKMGISVYTVQEYISDSLRSVKKSLSPYF